jgi:hypothetical protein
LYKKLLAPKLSTDGLLLVVARIALANKVASQFIQLAKIRHMGFSYPPAMSQRNAGINISIRVKSNTVPTDTIIQLSILISFSMIIGNLMRDPVVVLPKR